MPRDIQVLPQTLINKIAAGEVIVRPASVVKELVENAFDAEASHVRVELSKDVRTITVSDDGVGMDEANARRAVLRNATSKIRDFDDLEQLLSRGFRGEALASIVSVSRFEMLTRPRGALAGTRLVASGGTVESVEPVGTAEGTTFHIRDLFYNTPARLKFLKSPTAEYNALVQILTQQALSRPEVGLACVREGKVRFELAAGQDLKSRIEDLLGASVHGKLLEVDFEREDFRVRGYVALPEAARKDRRWQYLMVNGRPIAPGSLTHPLQQAYHGLLMTQRFPVAVLDLRMNPLEVDVNVHPTKEEVRFEEERKVAGLLYRAVQEPLQRQCLIPELGGGSEKETEATGPGQPDQSPSPGPSGRAASPSTPARGGGQQDPSLDFLFSPKGRTDWTKELGIPRARSGAGEDMFPARHFNATGQSSGSTTPLPGPAAAREAEPSENAEDWRDLPFDTAPRGHCDGPPPEPDPFAAAGHDGPALGDGPPPVPLGQLGRTYLICEWGDDLLMIDQHAAHERLVYMQLRRRERREPPRQTLMLPLELRLGAGAAGEMEEVLPLLEEMGYEIAPGPDKPGHFLVSAVPADFDGIDVQAMVEDLLDDLRAGEAGQGPLGVDGLRDKLLIRMACHGAIRAGQKLHLREMQALIEQMNRERLSFTCPHGRPTMVRLSKTQLDRQFGRLG